MRVGAKILTRQVESSTGEGSQNDMTLHFGLGKHDKEVKVVVTWPNGNRQELTSDVDRLINLTMTVP